MLALEIRIRVSYEAIVVWLMLEHDGRMKELTFFQVKPMVEIRVLTLEIFFRLFVYLLVELKQTDK